MGFFDVIGRAFEILVVFNIRSLFWKIATEESNKKKAITYFLILLVYMLVLTLIAMLLSVWLVKVLYDDPILYQGFLITPIVAVILSLITVYRRYNILTRPPSLDELRKDFVCGAISEEQFTQFYPSVKRQVLKLKGRIQAEKMRKEKEKDDRKNRLSECIKELGEREDSILKKERIKEIVSELKRAGAF